LQNRRGLWVSMDGSRVWIRGCVTIWEWKYKGNHGKPMIIISILRNVFSNDYIPFFITALCKAVTDIHTSQIRPLSWKVGSLTQGYTGQVGSWPHALALQSQLSHSAKLGFFMGPGHSFWWLRRVLDVCLPEVFFPYHSLLPQFVCLPEHPEPTTQLWKAQWQWTPLLQKSFDVLIW
jgi:hypothetical protein